MTKFKRLLACTSFFALTAQAAVLVPKTPTIESPQNGSTDVELNAELDSSTIAATDASGTAIANITLEKSRWFTMEAVDGVQILGGATPDYANQDKFYQDVDLGFTVDVHGNQATKLRVYPYAKLELLSSTGQVLVKHGLAQVNGLDYLKPSDDNNFIVVKKDDGVVYVRWNLKIKSIKKDVQIFINKTLAGYTFNSNATSDSLFGTDEMGFRCGAYKGSQIKEGDFSFKKIKSSIANNNNFSKMGFLCSHNLRDNGSVDGSLLKDKFADVTTFVNTDSISVVESASTKLTTHSPFSLSTQYVAYVSHKLNSGGLVKTSNWSAPSRFTTRSAKTVYAVTPPTNTKFVEKKAKTLAFTLQNTGTEKNAKAVFEIKAAITNPLNLVNGSLSDFFKVTINGNKCSSINSNSGVTKLLCKNFGGIEAGASVKADVNFTVPKSLTSIQYRLCDEGKCADSDYKTLNISVEAAAEGASSGTKTSSSSSSSGGSAMHLLALMLVLAGAARRRA